MSFDLFIFFRDVERVAAATQAGVAGVVVDWEGVGKRARQGAADTEVNQNTFEDLVAVRRAVTATVVCRINAVSDDTPNEVDAAIEGGADEILVPMIRRPDEVDAVLDLARGRVPVGILVETSDAVTCAADLARRPLSRAYVGLTDLWIERASASIFDAVVDGTVESVRRHFDVPFGFAGLTLPDRGAPVPCALLIAEMARLRCEFSFLRRSFYADMTGRSFDIEVPRLLAAVEGAACRTDSDVEAERVMLQRSIGRPQVEATAG